MTKRNNCKICGNYAGKSDTCKNCKKKYPYKEGLEKGEPFERKKEYEKDRRKKK